jgi:quercetin dioxygenase-like cupin family protein
MNDTDEKMNDAVKVAPHLHVVLFENDKVRVLQVKVKPGEQAAMHWHPENITYVQSTGRLRFTKPDGSTADAELSEGLVRHGDAGSHAVKNVGEQRFEAIQVELKEQ